MSGILDVVIILMKGINERERRLTMDIMTKYMFACVLIAMVSIAVGIVDSLRRRWLEKRGVVVAPDKWWICITVEGLAMVALSILLIV